MQGQRPSDVAPIGDWSRLLDGRVAVVTGGGDGIGGAISALFAAHGALVEVAEVDGERAERTVRAIRTSGGTVRGHVVDVTRIPDVERLADADDRADDRIHLRRGTQVLHEGFVDLDPVERQHAQIGQV